jgi:hypothetical protein
MGLTSCSDSHPCFLCAFCCRVPTLMAVFSKYLFCPPLPTVGLTTVLLSQRWMKLQNLHSPERSHQLTKFVMKMETILFPCVKVKHSFPSSASLFVRLFFALFFLPYVLYPLLHVLVVMLIIFLLFNKLLKYVRTNRALYMDYLI